MLNKGHKISARILSVLLSVMMLIQMMPAGAIAEAAQSVDAVEWRSTSSEVLGADVVYHTVRFITLDADGQVADTVGSKLIADGESVGSLPEAPARENYDFTGWTLSSGEAVGEGTTVTDDMTIIAAYAESMPEKYFSAIVNGMYVSVTAPAGAFPATTTMDVKAISRDAVCDAVAEVIDGEVGRLKAVDITFRDGSGREIEPKKEVSVKLRAFGMSDAEDLSVVHIDDSGEATLVDAAMTGTRADFTTDAFSIYIIVEGEPKRVTFQFWNGVDKLGSETITEEDRLYDPGVTAEYGQKFMGWSLVQNSMETLYLIDPDHPNTSTDSLNVYVQNHWDSFENDSTINLYAQFKEAYYLRYLTKDGDKTTVLYTEMKEKDDTDKWITFVDGDVFTENENQEFEGWLSADGTTIYHVGDRHELNEHLDVYLKIRGHYWLVFNDNDIVDGRSGGASYTPPQLLLGDQTTMQPAENPQWTGYKFMGWNEEPDGSGTWWLHYGEQGNEIGTNRFGDTLTSDITLYAQWEGVETSYYIVIWRQQASDEADIDDDAKKYDYAETIKLEEKTGTLVQIRSEDTQHANTEGYKHFHYNADKTDTDAVRVAADGSTVLNVYYDRDVFTLTFRDYTYTATTSNNGTQYGLVDGAYVQLTRHGRGNWMSPYYWTYGTNEITYTGTRYTRSASQSTVATIKALYEHIIKGKFPIQGTNGFEYKLGTRWKPTQTRIVDGTTYFTEGVVVVYVDIMPPCDETFDNDDENGAGKTDKTMRYYVQALPTDTNTTSYTAKKDNIQRNFKKYCNDIVARYSYVSIEDFMEITGFTKLVCGKLRA